MSQAWPNRVWNTATGAWEADNPPLPCVKNTTYRQDQAWTADTGMAPGSWSGGPRPGQGAASTATSSGLARPAPPSVPPAATHVDQADRQSHRADTVITQGSVEAGRGWVRPLSQLTLAVNYASSEPVPITDPNDRRAWEDSRAQVASTWTAAIEAENIAQARESGMMPSWCMSFGNFETIYGSFDQSFLNIERKPGFIGLGNQMSPFLRRHPAYSIAVAEESGGSLREARLTRQDDDGIQFHVYLVKHFRYAKVTIAACMDYPQSAFPCDWEEDLSDQLAEADAADLLYCTQATMESGGKRLETDQQPYLTLVITRVFSPDDESRNLRKEMLARIILESHYTDTQLSVESNIWVAGTAAKLRYEPLDRSVLQFHLTVQSAFKVYSYTWMTGGRLFALTTKGKVAMLGVPRQRCEVRAVDPSIPDACGYEGDRIEVAFRDYKFHLNLQTDTIMCPQEVFRVSKAGQALNNLIDAARRGKAKIDGPEPDVGPRVHRQIHGPWMERNEFQLGRPAPCGQLIKEGGDHWRPLNAVHQSGGRHSVFESRGVVDVDGIQEVCTQSIAHGWHDGRRQPMLRSDDREPTMEARSSPVIFGSDCSTTFAVEEVDTNTPAGVTSALQTVPESPEGEVAAGAEAGIAQHSPASAGGSTIGSFTNVQVVTTESGNQQVVA